MSNTTTKVPDPYCVIQDDEQDFYWFINLEDHPNSFLLDKKYQHFIVPRHKKEHESMVIIQPGN